jgi:YVTN family beta-propeller protein
VATGSGSVWGAVADEDVVARIDPSTGEVTNIGVGNFPREIAIGAGRAWVTNGRGNSVTPIDLTTEAAGAAIEVGASPHGVTVGEGAVWVTNRVDGTVSKIDPESALVDGEAILVGGNPKGIAVAAEIVWVANTDDASVSMIDPSTDEVVGTLEVGAMPRGVTAAFDSIWVASGSGVVTQIDAEARMVVATIDLTELEPGASPEEIAADKNQLWVTTGEGDSVIRISPG